MASKAIVYDGASVKSLNDPNLWPGDVAARTLDEHGAYSTVAWCYRGVMLRANAVSNMPYVVTKFDKPIEWKHKDSLAALLWLTEASLCVYGAAYWFRRRNRLADIGYQHMATPTITPEYSDKNELTGFKRQTQTTATTLTPDDVVWFWMPDPGKEQGPGRAPLSVALTAAGVAKAIDQYSESFFQRGAITATILSVEGNPASEELRALEAWWKRLLQGVSRAWETVAVRATVKPQVIGQPNKDLAMSELQSAMRGQIAVALGVPQTMMEDAAQVATRVSEDRMAFYTETIIPECGLIAGVLNKLVFAPQGLAFAFSPERLDIMQEDEAERATSLKALKDAGIPLDLAMELLGYDLTDEQKARLMEEVSKPEPIPPVVVAGQVPPEKQEPEEPKPNPMMKADIERWQRKCEKAGKARPFESENIPKGIKLAIEERLADDPETAWDFLKKFDAHELAVRYAAEKRLKGEVAKEFLAQWDKAAEAIMAGQEWDEAAFSEAVRKRMDSALAKITTEHMLRLAVEIGIDFDVAVVNAAALAWAEKFTYHWIADITDTTRPIVANAVSKFVATPGMTMGELRDALEYGFSPLRADRIAVTEVTRAYSAATDIYKDMLDKNGLKFERVWRTSEDDRVCEICGPLEDKPESAWPGGPPPGHVGCRCWDVLDYKGKA